MHPTPCTAEPRRHLPLIKPINIDSTPGGTTDADVQGALGWCDDVTGVAELGLIDLLQLYIATVAISSCKLTLFMVSVGLLMQIILFKECSHTTFVIRAVCIKL